MADLSPDLSMYPANPGAYNPLTSLEHYAAASNAIKSNQLIQQHVIHAEAENKLLQGQIGLGKVITNHTDPHTGETDFNGALAEASQNPDTAPVINQLMQMANQQNEGVNAGVNPDGTPKIAARQAVNAKLNPQQVDTYHDHLDHMQSTILGLLNKPDLSMPDVINAAGDLVGSGHISAQEAAAEFSNMPTGPDMGDGQSLKQVLQQQFNKVTANKAALTSRFGPKSAPSPQGDFPTIATGTAQGFTTPLAKSRANYDEVVDTAKGAPQMNAAYNEAINLNKAGAPTGTNIANLYAWAAKNVPSVSKGVTDKAAQAQEIGKWMSQGLIANGMPASDARLQELQHANLNPDQLPETIKELAPFFKAVSQGAIAKQNYYNRETKNGVDLTNEPKALEKWNNNYDPRWIEFDELPNKKAKTEFLVKHSDLLKSRDKHEALKEMGVLKG